MTAFTQRTPTEAPVQRPSRWSPSNWPVRWKVLAIVLVPLILAGAFGGLRIQASVSEAAELGRAADRAELIPEINSYLAALEGAMVTATEGRETQSALADFDARKAELQERLDGTDVVPDVRLAVTTLLGLGQDLINKVMDNSLDLRQRVLAYAPLLLTAETAITGSTRSDEQQVQLQAQALSRAIGARGQMAMQQMLVNRGGDVPEPELRTSMITLAGTEPSTVSGMAGLLGGASDEASTLRSEMFQRMSVMSDPAAVLAGNPDLLASQQVTRGIAEELIAATTAAIPNEVNAEANAQRSNAIRDAVLVLVAIITALAIVLFVARSLVRPLRTLRDSALKVAHEDLATEIERVRAGGDPGPVAPIPVHTTEEVGQVAHAVDELHEQAVLLAGEQARLQLQIGDMFETLSRRSRSLVDQQLSLIDRLERNEDDPERLESLFRLDHLAARMRRNGANLLVLAGAKVPREQVQPVAVATLINAAASEVEDYTRVLAAVVPDSEVAGAVAGDLVHILAELLDNALRYSPPVAQVRVSAVHTGNGALVIEVSDTGLGMTEADLRMANTRLQSGGEVDPYTARHMGLFVVGRLATQHGLVVRLRSTVADEPNSGTTAGVYVPAELIVTADAAVVEPYAAPADAHAGIATALALDHEDQHHNGYYDDHTDIGFAGLPQRDPGASGISEFATPLGDPAPWEEPAEPPTPAPTNTAAFFASREQAASNGMAELQPAMPAALEPFVWVAEPEGEPEPDRYLLEMPAGPSADAGDDDAIYQKMLSEWLIDPTEIANSSDLNWESVWDHGWSAAEAAEQAPVREVTEEGLPVREPGARLVPGGMNPTAADPALNGGYRNGGAHRSDEADSEVESTAELDTGPILIPLRDPDAVRASISNHFGGVHAGRTHARETRGTDFA